MEGNAQCMMTKIDTSNSLALLSSSDQASRYFTSKVLHRIFCWEGMGGCSCNYSMLLLLCLLELAVASSYDFGGNFILVGDLLPGLIHTAIVVGSECFEIGNVDDQAHAC